MTDYLKHTIQQFSVDNRGSTDCSISKQEGTSSGEDGIGHSQRPVHSHVELQLRAHVAK